MGPLTGNVSVYGQAVVNGASLYLKQVNANGGVNIPLAVGAPTDTAAVNRLYAAGLEIPQIGRTLYITENSVKEYLKRIRAKYTQVDRPAASNLTCTLLVTCAVEHVGYVVGGHGLGLELSAGQSDGDVLQGA